LNLLTTSDVSPFFQPFSSLSPLASLLFYLFRELTSHLICSLSAAGLQLSCLYYHEVIEWESRTTFGR